jgi:hypothetical protein
MSGIGKVFSVLGDKLKPGYKSQSSQKRIQWLKRTRYESENIEIINRIASSDEDSKVRIQAINCINDPYALLQIFEENSSVKEGSSIKCSSEFPEVREALVSALLYDFAFEDRVSVYKFCKPEEDSIQKKILHSMTESEFLEVLRFEREEKKQRLILKKLGVTTVMTYVKDFLLRRMAFEEAGLSGTDKDLVDIANHAAENEKRSEALNKISDPSSLFDLALSASQTHIQKEALELVRVEDLLEAHSNNSYDTEKIIDLLGKKRAAEALEKLYNDLSSFESRQKIQIAALLPESKRFYLVLKTADTDLQKELIQLIQDRELLQGLLSELKDYDLCQYVIRKAKLSGSRTEHMFKALRAKERVDALQALNKITEEADLVEIALYSDWGDVQESAFARLKNEYSFISFLEAVGENDLPVRFSDILSAVEQINDLEALFKLLQNCSFDESVVHKILDKLNNEEIVQQLIKSNPSEYFRRAAIQKIRDVDFLMELKKENKGLEKIVYQRLGQLDGALLKSMLSTELEHDSRESIVSSISDENILYEISVDEEEKSSIRKAALQNIKDEKILVKICSVLQKSARIQKSKDFQKAVFEKISMPAEKAQLLFSFLQRDDAEEWLDYSMDEEQLSELIHLLAESGEDWMENQGVRNYLVYGARNFSRERIDEVSEFGESSKRLMEKIMSDINKLAPCYSCGGRGLSVPSDFDEHTSDWQEQALASAPSCQTCNGRGVSYLH